MSNHMIPDIKQQAREDARNTLMDNAAYMSLPMSDQKNIYVNLVEENMDKLARQHGLVKEMARPKPGEKMGFGGYDPGFEESVDAFEDLVDSVDFPAFVSDLLKSVFDANMNVIKKQTDTYIKLMKEATKSVSDFVKNVKDDETFAYLAENKSDQFNILMEDDPDGGSKLSLTSPEGEKVDMEDNEVKAKIMEAKIAMAKEHRAALREVLLMGVTRLVVEKGEVEAGVEFRITANRNSTKSRKNTNINTVNAQYSYSPPLGGLFGGPSGSVSVNNTNINVSTAKKTADDELFAQLKGKVKIQFKTDYFKMDNFLQMYGDGGVQALQPAQPGQPPVQAPR
jgi:hypothetical protein